MIRAHRQGTKSEMSNQDSIPAIRFGQFMKHNVRVGLSSSRSQHGIHNQMLPIPKATHNGTVSIKPHPNHTKGGNEKYEVITVSGLRGTSRTHKRRPPTLIRSDLQSRNATKLRRYSTTQRNNANARHNKESNRKVGLLDVIARQTSAGMCSAFSLEI